jgi:hypothetical protein
MAQSPITQIFFFSLLKGAKEVHVEHLHLTGLDRPRLLGHSQCRYRFQFTTNRMGQDDESLGGTRCLQAVSHQLCEADARLQNVTGVFKQPRVLCQLRVQLPHLSRVARCSCHSSRPLEGAEGEALSGYGSVSD